jgi:hypothetical protein
MNNLNMKKLGLLSAHLLLTNDSVIKSILLQSVKLNNSGVIGEVRAIMTLGVQHSYLNLLKGGLIK